MRFIKEVNMTFAYYCLMFLSATITAVFWLKKVDIHSSFLILLLGCFIIYKMTGRKVTFIYAIYSVYLQILTLIYFVLFGTTDPNNLASALLGSTPLILIILITVPGEKEKLKNWWKIITGRY